MRGDGAAALTELKTGAAEQVERLWELFPGNAGLEVTDGLLVQPLIGKKKRGDYTPEAVIRGYERLLGEFLDRVDDEDEELRVHIAYPEYDERRIASAVVSDLAGPPNKCRYQGGSSWCGRIRMPRQ